MSVRCRLSASEKPELWTDTVKLLGVPPAVTVGSANVFVTERWTSSVAVVSLEASLLPPFGSSVPSEATLVVLCRLVPLSTVESSVT